MKISIITPTYNRSFCIGRCMRSVARMRLPQGYDYEHIIIDDGSTDNTKTVVLKEKDKKVRYFSLKKNSGINAARNVGLKNAKGQYVLLLDSDDEITQDALVKIKTALEKTKQKYVLYNFQTRHYKTGRLMSYIQKPYKPITYKEHLAGTAMCGEFCSVYKTSTRKKVMFDEDRFAFEGFYWNKLLKTYESEIGVDKVLRIYHDEHEDRFSKKLLQPRFAERRLKDYVQYVKLFGKDYRLYGLKKQLAHVYMKCGFYAMLVPRQSGRIFFKTSLHEQVSLSGVLFFLLSFLGRLPFRALAVFFEKRA